jgi:hypothetical protein
LQTERYYDRNVRNAQQFHGEVKLPPPKSREARSGKPQKNSIPQLIWVPQRFGRTTISTHIRIVILRAARASRSEVRAEPKVPYSLIENRVQRSGAPPVISSSYFVLPAQRCGPSGG